MAFQLVQVVLVPVFWLCCLVVLVQAVRSPRNAVLRYFAAVVVLLVLANSISFIDHATSALERLVFNLVGVAAVYAQVCFFRTALRRYRNRPVYGGETVAVVAVMVIGIVAWTLAPAEVRPVIGQPASAVHPGVVVFVFSILGYGFVSAVRIVVWCIRLIRQLRGSASSGRRVIEIGFEISLVIVVVAQLALLVSYGGKLVSTVAVFTAPSRTPVAQAFYAPLALVANLGNLVFVLGIIVPVLFGAVAAALVARRHRRDHRVLQPLWTAVRAAYPQLPLRTQRGINGRFYRRGLEVKDSLLLLAPYYDGAVADATAARCRADGRSDAETSVHVAAVLVADALDNQRTGRLIVDPHPVPVSGADDWASDMAWLLRVARVYTAVARPSRVPS